MTKNLLILGRQPALGRVELESLFGASAISRFDSQSVIYEGELDSQRFARLGGTVKAAGIIAELDSTSWPDVEQYVLHKLPTQLPLPDTGKLQLGVSVYNLPVSAQKVQAIGLSLKKSLRTADRSVRLIPNKEPALSTAQVLHNHLTGRLGCEIVIYAAANRTVIARTSGEQNINSYTLRDRERPKRDARVGMLPPKLAQIIINLATGQSAVNSQTIVLDPFCGTGVVLQEALLMGYGAYGSDLEPRMITYTQDNLAWLDRTFHTEVVNTHLEIGDATTHAWKHPFTVVAGETYLGQPLGRLPDGQKLQTIVHACNQIISKFLRNIHGQMPSGTRLCLAVPAWQIRPDQFKHLPLIDQISDLGYNRISFEHAEDSSLVYYRPNQIVGRELFVLTIQ